VAEFFGTLQGCLAELVCDVWVSTVLEEINNNITLAFLCGVQQRCAAFRGSLIHVGTTLDKLFYNIDVTMFCSSI